MLAEKAEEAVLAWAKAQGLPADEWEQHNIECYGAPAGDQKLETIIDTSNIHGWLQECIRGTELRQAALMTAILGIAPDATGALAQIFAAQGKQAAQQYAAVPQTAEEIYNVLNDFLLEGMPCDRVNEVLMTSDDKLVWQTTTCLHTPYWKQVQGDVRNFYVMREAWVSAFIETIAPTFRYERTGEGIQSIVRMQ